MNLKEAMKKAKETGKPQKVTEPMPKEPGKKKYLVGWLETRVIQRDVYTFVHADNKEEALEKVKNRKNHNVHPDTKISRYSATYKGKAR